MRTKTKRNLTKYLLISQVSIYAFIILHAVLWYVFGIHVLTKLCPFLFADQVGRLELNFAILFWVLIFISTLFAGRAFCAWGCMFGAYQDFVQRLVKILKIKPVSNKLGKWLLRFILILLTIGFILSNKNFWPSFYWFLATTILIGLITWNLFEKGNPKKNPHTLPKYILLVQYLGGIIALWFSLNIFQKGFSFVFDKYSVFHDENWVVQIALAAVIALSIGLIEKRVFCRYLCPVGMVLRLTSSIPFPKKFKVRATGSKCSQCGICNRECLMGLNPMEEINKYGVVTDPNCINCLACVSKCPKDAIDFKTKQL
ncbi:MAG TPA: 4Fe-4S binding protein [Clostridia bacterium]